MARTVKQVFKKDKGDVNPNAMIKAALSGNKGNIKSLKIKMKFGKDADKDDKPKKKVNKVSNWKY